MTAHRDHQSFDTDPLPADPWAGAEVVPGWEPVSADASPFGSADPDDPPREEPAAAPDTPTGVAADPRQGRLAELRRRLFGTANAPLFLVAVGALVLVAVAGGWRLAVTCAVAAAAVATTRLRFSVWAALGLLAVASLLALAGWGPGALRTPSAAHLHHAHHAHAHAQRAKG